MFKFPLGLVLLPLLFPTKEALNAFDKFSWVQWDLKRYEGSCNVGKQASALQQFEVQYTKLNRVLVIDAAQNHEGVNGAGNLLGDYAAWFTWGLLTERAVFIRWTSCIDPDSKCGIFDLGHWFKGANNTSWHWNTHNGKRLNKVLGPLAERRIQTPEDITSDPRLLWDILHGSDSWITLKIHNGIGLLPLPKDPDFEATSTYADMLIGQSYLALVRKLDIPLPAAAQERDDKADLALVESQFGLHVRGCVLHWALRPRPKLQSALAPLLRYLNNVDGLVALHVRSFYADIPHVASNLQSLSENFSAAVPRWFNLQKWDEGSPKERWESLNEIVLRGGFTRKNTDPLLSRCADDTFSGWIFGAPQDAGLAPYVSCAMRASREAAQRASAREWDSNGTWAVYIASDLSLIPELLTRLPQLNRRVIAYCFGNSQCPYTHTGVAHSGFPGSGAEHKKTAVDAWMLGLAQRTLPVTASTFPRFAERSTGILDKPQLLDGDDDGFALSNMSGASEASKVKTLKENEFDNAKLMEGTVYMTITD
ncbi:hypothetical protein CYMTET_22788 [Cymbomonas tetramitiformis]|uniref:Uncharacterized protein n=1 Tax=Cymbomonas tetramitiformis TaxID=36881 RepID=A0AAE0FZQ0_9CHLO|nr:hypothetical protein CYMTET_22788 [Cymbomonas tetramitiformis]